MTTESETNTRGPEPLPLKAKPRKPTVALNRKTILVLVLILGILAGAAILQGLSGNLNARNSAVQEARVTQIGDAVRNLPNDYGAIPRPKPTLGPPLHGELGPAEVAFKQNSGNDEEKFKAEQKLLRLKQAALARSADVSFSSVRFDTRDGSESGGMPGGAPGTTGLSAGQSGRDDDNRQDDKYSFLSGSRDQSPVLGSTLIRPLTKYQVMAGSVLPGVLLTGINSDLPGQIVGQLSQNVLDTKIGKYLLLPQGTKLIGEYDSRVTYGQERVLIVWTRLILPSTKSISLEGMPGVDLSGNAGLHERVNNHYLKLLSGVVLGSVLGAGAQMAHGSNRTVDPSFGQLALEGMAQNINQAGQQITRKNLNIQPTLEISPGQRFNVFVTKDLVLEPYQP